MRGIPGKSERVIPGILKEVTAKVGGGQHGHRHIQVSYLTRFPKEPYAFLPSSFMPILPTLQPSSSDVETLDRDIQRESSLLLQ